MVERFRWGILGTAEIAKAVIRGIRRSSNGEVVAVASRSAARARLWAADLGIPLAFGSYEELLRAKVVDGIYLPLPNALHARWTQRALEQGYPVLCEKPLTVDAAEAERVREASLSTGLFVAEAFMYRFHPVIDRAVELVRRGELGEISTILGRFTFRLEDRAANVFSDSLGGGALLDVGCYGVNVSRLLTGLEPMRVAAFERRSTVDEVVVAQMEFPGGVLAQCEAGISSFERHRVEVAGTTGALVMEQPWVPGEGETGFTVYRSGRDPEWVAVPGANTYQMQAEHFVQVVRGEAKARWGLEDAVANMRVLEAIASSARAGTVVMVGRRAGLGEWGGVNKSG